ncbi:MAG: hypothetical protein ACYC3S_18100 [Chloroflexota bacterium]
MTEHPAKRPPRPPALNAVNHGALARTPVLPGESAAEWENHRDQTVTALHVAGDLPLIDTLALRVALLLWRLRRIAEWETDLLTQSHRAAEVHRQTISAIPPEYRTPPPPEMPDAAELATLARYEAHLTRQISQTLRTLESIRATTKLPNEPEEVYPCTHTATHRAIP